MLNKCIFIGNLGADPEIKMMQNGKPVCNLRLAVTEKWKSKEGERRERTEWVRVVIFSEGLCRIAEQYLKKGSKIYVEGQMQTRKWEKDGADVWTTEIVLQNFNSTLVMLDSRSEQGGDFTRVDTPQRQAPSELDDEIPF